MRYVCSTAAILALTILAPSMMFAQNGAAGLSIENYQFVSEQRSTRTEWYVTYRAELVNTGVARPGVVATLSSLVPTVKTVPGQTMLHFGPVAAGGRVWSTDTFTILVDRSVAFSFNQLQWSFLNPVAVPGPDQTAPVGTTINLNGSGSTNPSGVGTLSYLWAFVSRPAGSAATLTTPNSVTTSFTIDRPGDYIVSLTVNNGVAQDTRTVKISTVNSPPVANAGPNQSVAVGANVNLNGSASFDVDGDPLTYWWTFVSLPAGSQAFIGGFRSVTANFTPDLAGTYIIQLVVNDGKVDSAPSTVTINAGAPGNTAPVANAGPNQSGVAIGAVVQLNGSGSTDVDGDPLTYKWTLITVPAGSTAALSNPNIVNPTFVPNVAGTYVAQLIVNDGKIDSAPSTVTISTAAQAPGVPTANAGPNQTVVHGTLVQLTGAASTDPQNLPLTFTWSLITRPAGSNAVLSNANIVNPTFVADRPGNYVAQLIVNNGTLNSAPATVTITTTNTAPVANAGPNQTVTVGAVVALNGSGSSDADNDPLTFSWTFTTRPNGSNATLSAANSATPTFVADLVGTYVVQLIVNDGFANSNPATVQITVNGQGGIVAPATLTIGPGNMVLYDIRLAQAPANDVNVELGGFDTTKITLSATSILFRAGSTTPSRDVTITAVAVGTTTINATSPGLTPASTAVTVGITATLTPANLIIPGPSPDGTLNIQLSNPSQNNITFNVVSSNPSVATVPSIVPLSAGGTSIGFKVTRAGAGSAVITVSAPGFPNMTSNVTVEPPGSISLSISNSNLYLWIPQTLTITLSTPATNGGAVVTLNGNATFLRFSQNPVTIPSGATQATVQVTGVQVGNPTIGATAPGFTAAVPLQVAVGATIHWVQPTLTVTNYPQELLLSLGLDALVPGSTAFDPNDGITINLSSTRPDVVTVPSSQTFYWDGSTAPVLRIQAQAVGPGTAIIKASGINIPEVQMTITVTGPLAITTASLPSGTVGTAYSAPLAATGGVTPYSWAATGLPANLTINPTTGVISGTPQAPGTSTVNVTVQDSSNPKLTGTATFQLQITSTPASIAVQSGSGQSTQVKTAFANPLQAIVRDSNNNPLSGVTVTFTAPANGGNPTGTFNGGVSTVTATTNAAGIATSPVFTANNKAGTYNVSASVNNGALTTNFSLTNTAGPAASIAVQSGSNQSALINQAFANPLVAIVKDADDNPVPNVSVTYTPPAAGASGTFAGGVNTATTNASGLATSAVFTANGTVSPGGTPYIVTAFVTNNPALTTNPGFSLTNTQNPPASIAVQSGSGQSAKINTAFTNTLQAVVRDAGNNPVSGVTVTFTPPASNGNNATGTFAGGVNTAVTNAQGIATSAVFTANNKTGTYNVGASVGGVPTPAQFSLTNTPGDPASIVVSSGSGQSAMINQAFGQPLKVLVKDVGDNPVPNVSVTYTPPASGASGTFAGGVNTATTGADGIATSAVFTANGTVSPGGTPYNVVASVTNNPALTTNFSLTNTENPPASIAVHGGSPQSAKILTAFGNLLQVIVRDAGNNPLSGVTVTFTPPVSTGSNATGTFAGGVNTAVTNAQGVATSAVFTANNKVGQYNVAASVNNGALSTNFSLTNTVGDPHSIAVQSGSPQSAQINTAFANPLVAIVKDVGDNPVPGATVTFTSPASTGSNATGTFAGGVNTATTNASGVATSAVFTANNKVGTYNVSAGVSGVATPAQFALTNTTGPAAAIAVVSGSNQSAAKGAAFANPLVARVADAGDNPVSGVTVTFTAPGSGASGTFANGQISTTAVTNASGIATSSTFTANNTEGPYVVAATAPGVAAAANFSLTNTQAPPASIVVANGSSPQSAVVTTVYGSVLKALVRDANSNPVGGVTVNFTAPGSGASGAFQGGVTTAVTDAAGIASSAPFTANAVAGSFLVRAVVASNQSIFVDFQLTNLPGPAAAIQVVSGTPQSATIGASFANPLVARVTDQFANPIAGAQVTFTAPASGASAVFATTNNNTVTVATNAAGNATSTTATANQNTGQYNVTATTPGVAGSAAFVLNNTFDPNNGVITVTDATIGKDLQESISITLNPPAPQAGLQLTITVTDETKALVGSVLAVGTKTFQTNVSGGASSLGTVVKALVGSGSTTVTVSAPGYNPGTATITFAPSGFVISSPNGIGAQFNTFLGATTPLTVFSGRLGQGNLFVQTQALRGGISANVPVATNVTSVGTVTPSPASFTGGSNSAAVNFVASSTNTGSTDVIITNPAGFTTPATGTTVNAIVGSANLIPFTATVGKNLQKAVRINLNAPAAQNVIVTITSSNPAKVKFSTNQNNAGSDSINVSIPQNFSISQEFYVQVFDTVGSPCAGAPPEAPPVCVPYTASANGLGTVNGEVRLAPSGLLIESPGGFGVGSFSIQQGQTGSLTIYAGVVSNNVVTETQAVAAGLNIPVTVVSSNTSAGTITTSPVTITGGSFSATTQFTAANPAPAEPNNTSQITASSNGYQSAAVTATVLPGRLLVGPRTVGNRLQTTSLVSLVGQAAPGGGLTVHLVSSSPSLKLATTPTAAGQSEIDVFIPGGSISAVVYFQGNADSGTATVTATAPNFAQGQAAVTLVPSSIIVFPPSVGGNVGGSSSGVTLFAVAQIGGVFESQQVAGGPGVVVPINTTNAGVAAVPANVTIPAATDTANLTINYVGAGSAVVSVTQPAGFTNPGSSTAVSVNVNP